MKAGFTFGALALLAACGGAASGVSEPPAAAPTRQAFIELSEAALGNAGIVVTPVQTTTRADRILAPGLIALDETRTARVGSLQEGLILDTPAQVGDRVRARQLLATMHGHAMHDAWAGYRKAIADQRRLDKELAYAIDAHERAQRLYTDKAISLQELQRAEVDRVSATQMVDMARAEVNRSIEELEHVGVSIATSKEDDPLNPADESAEEIPVRSPIAGTILERLVTPGTTVTPGTPLFVVSELSTLWVIAEIDESQIARVKAGRPVDVVVAAYPDEHFSGTITFIADVVNPKTRRVTVRSVVPNPDGRLKPEMFATVALGEGEPREIVVVPQAAVQTIDGQTSVFVAEGRTRFTPRPVSLGTAPDGLVEIASGLTPGELVVVDGSFVLKSQMLQSSAEGGQ
jgi:cobalt-zinc-cadmium efflux system membrane fusion protein